MKKAIITGATGGIGSKIAEALVAHDYEIILLCRTSDDLKELEKKLLKSHENTNIKTITCDVSDYDALKEHLKNVPEVDVLINCAGILGPVGPFLENNIEEWHKTIDINLGGTINSIHILLEKLLKSKRGKIINFSGGGAASPRICHSAYASSKVAVVRFTEILAAEYPQIDVNAIAPGAHKTGIWKTETYDKEPAVWGDMNRLQELILYLCSPESDGLTSKLIHINDSWDKKEFRNASNDYYTLRRIDERLIANLKNPVSVRKNPPAGSKVCVFGLWHLGSVTSACLADLGFEVIGLDSDKNTIANLNKGKAPLYEPDLDKLIQKGLSSGKLSFSTDMKGSLSSADFVWVAFDVPVDENDVADIPFMERQMISILPYLKNDTCIVTSSQVPVGFANKIKRLCDEKYRDKNIAFAVSPENLRLGNAINVFENPDRIIVGINSADDKKRFEPLFNAITNKIEWMSVESAEMTKHAINSFLAMSVVFANELGVLCEAVGADAKEVERGLKSEERIGRKAYLGPGLAFSGGTLARDVNFLIEKGKENNKKLMLVQSIKDSNEHHKSWVRRKCQELFPDISKKHFVLLGLTYKSGTNSLRRSSVVELCEWLHNNGAIVTVFDQHVESLPSSLEAKIELIRELAELKKVLQKADCIIVSNENPLFKEEDIVSSMENKIIIDPTRFLGSAFEIRKPLKHISIGKDR